MPFLIPGTGILGGKKKKRRRSFVNRNFDEDEIDLENLIFEDLMNTDPMLIKGGERSEIIIRNVQKPSGLSLITGVAKKIVHFYLLRTVNKSGLSSLPPL